MLIVGVAVSVIVVFGLVLVRRGRTAPASWLGRVGVGIMALSLGAAGSLAAATGASAAIVETVPLGTATSYVVVGGQSVTNTGPSVLNGDVGVSPGTSVTGFPPGLVVPPGVTHIADGVALQAQADLTTAYDNAAGRPLNATVAADLTDLTLQGGVYAVDSKGAMGLTGPLVLDGANNPSSVWIFQTDSTLITGSGSTVSLINGALACNVFWQVGSSATLATNSHLVGTVMALTSVTVATGATLEGRALARNGSVTLDTNTFVDPTCQEVPVTTTTTEVPVSTTEVPITTTTTEVPITTTTTEAPGTTTTTAVPGPTTTVAPAPTTTEVPAPSTTTSTINARTTVPEGVQPTTSTTAADTSITVGNGESTTSTTNGTGTGTGTGTGSGPGSPAPPTDITTGGLPRTGSPVAPLLLSASALLLLGLAIVLVADVLVADAKRRAAH